MTISGEGQKQLSQKTSNKLDYKQHPTYMSGVPIPTQIFLLCGNIDPDNVSSQAPT
ncbi:hypothetical protein OkiPb00196_48370 [Escherichia coli]